MIVSQLSRLHRPNQFRLQTSIARNTFPLFLNFDGLSLVLKAGNRLNQLPARCRCEKIFSSARSTSFRTLIKKPRTLRHLIALGIFFTFVVIKYKKPLELTLPFQLDSSVKLPTVHEDIPLKNMPTGLAPGRPGNLTEEQEIKIREFWQELLKVFGIWDSNDGNKASENGIVESRTENLSLTTIQDSSQQAGVTTDSKKHRSKLNPFSKKHKGQSNDSSSIGKSQGTYAAPSNGNSNNGTDKHGLSQSFREALSQQSPAELRDFFWDMIKHDDPDAILLRFLRARKWDVQAALVMLISALRWRSAEMHVDDDILKNGEAGALAKISSSDPKAKKEAEDFMQQLRLGKSFLHGCDSEGRPMCIVRVKLHRQGEQSEPSLERFTVYTLETARLLLRSPVDTAVRIVLSRYIDKRNDA